MKLYCIYDKNAELANPPFVAANNAIAIRQFCVQVNAPSTTDRVNVVHDYPSDFDLRYIGELDDKSLTMSSDIPIILTTAVDVLRNDM